VLPQPFQGKYHFRPLSAGLVFYELLTGKQAFKSRAKSGSSCCFLAKPSELQPDLSPGLDSWLQNLRLRSPKPLSNADTALQELTTLATLQTLDLTNLPVDSPMMIATEF